MNVKVTVSTSGKALNVGKSNSIMLKDVISLEEVKEALDHNFREFFPQHRPFDDIDKVNTKKVTKNTKTKGDE